MRTMLACVVLAAGGCGPYLDSQMRLVEQARKGVELCRTAQAERSQIIEHFHRMQRERLDEAFDADVRERDGLSAEWVIEHRKGYAAVLEQLARQRAAGAAAEAAAGRNLDAVDAALERLHWLQSAQLRWVDLDLDSGTK